MSVIVLQPYPQVVTLRSAEAQLLECKTGDCLSLSASGVTVLWP